MEKIITRRVRESLREGLRQAAMSAREQGQLQFEALPEIVLEVPKEKSHGSFASNLALILAKVVRKAPREAAALLQANFPANHYVARIEVAGPGFINFHLNQNWLGEVQAAILEEKTAYGDNSDLAGTRIQLEFVSANPVGPMVVVNARAAALGDTLANLFSACGAGVEREYYVNDFGNQVYTLGRSIDARYRQLLGQTVDFPEDGYQGDYIYDLARQLITERGDSYLALPEEERIASFRDFGYRTILAGQKRDLAAYGVEYDCWFSERSLHEQGTVDRVLDELVGRGLTYEQDGALWLRTTAYGDDKDRVLKTADGRTTYFIADIAYHLNKFERGFDLAIDIWGPDHHGYIPRMKAALAAMGIAPERLEVLIAQQINLIKDGQPFKMSKRRGDFITMADLLEEVGNDGARWFLLMRSPDSHLDFDLNLVKSQTNENPVFYVQYAHARIASIFRQAAPENLPAADLDPATYWDEEEEQLLEKLAHFPDLLSEAAKRREPHRVTGYLLELATMFHSYYNRRRFISEDPGQTGTRLMLARAIGYVLQRGLKLLGVSAPERM
ncbi:arginine--tRNA ligase [Hydrogenispora ethanolica]|nr:arginine--tRNA ligase [Hydrogenispora ethanolica]